jgi:hypothetical protein
MIRVYELMTPDQLAVMEPELRDTLREMQAEFDKTVDETWSDLTTYSAQWPFAAIWIALDDGRLAAWSAAKIYIDLPQTITGAVTWAWAAAGAGDAPRLLHATMDEWARGHGATALYAARRTRLDAYARWIGRYGYSFDRVVFVHHLTDAGASAAEAGAEHELRRSPEQLPVAAGDGGTPSAPSPATGPGHGDAGVDRPDGESPEHGDLRPAPASRVKPPKRRRRKAVRHRRVDGGTTVGARGADRGNGGSGRYWRGRRWIRPGVVQP